MERRGVKPLWAEMEVSPTRLEGMERGGSVLVVFGCALSPTRLEGMERVYDA